MNSELSADIGWINKAERPPTEADADFAGCVIAYHIYQGVMVCGWRNAISNRLITHWMQAPHKPDGINAREIDP